MYTSLNLVVYVHLHIVRQVHTSLFIYVLLSHYMYDCTLNTYDVTYMCMCIVVCLPSQLYSYIIVYANMCLYYFIGVCIYVLLHVPKYSLIYIYYRVCNGFHMHLMYNEEIGNAKLIYLGTYALELSKLTMMKFHYDIIQENFEGRTSIFSLMQTQSFI